MEEDYLLTPVEVKPDLISQSPARPLKKVILLNFLTFGFYSYYWFYRNWKDFQGSAWSRENWPLLRVIGLFIPIASLFLAYGHFKRIREEFSESAVKVASMSPVFLALGWQLHHPLLRLAMKQFAWALPFSLLPVLAYTTTILCVFQRGLNAHWADELPGEPMQMRFTTGEKVFLTLGSFLWIYQVWGLMLGD